MTHRELQRDETILVQVGDADRLWPERVAAADMETVRTVTGATFHYGACRFYHRREDGSRGEEFRPIPTVIRAVKKDPKHTTVADVIAGLPDIDEPPAAAPAPKPDHETTEETEMAAPKTTKTSKYQAFNDAAIARITASPTTPFHDIYTELCRTLPGPHPHESTIRPWLKVRGIPVVPVAPAQVKARAEKRHSDRRKKIVTRDIGGDFTLFHGQLKKSLSQPGAFATFEEAYRHAALTLGDDVPAPGIEPALSWCRAHRLAVPGDAAYSPATVPAKSMTLPGGSTIASPPGPKAEPGRGAVAPDEIRDADIDMLAEAMEDMAKDLRAALKTKRLAARLYAVICEEVA